MPLSDNDGGGCGKFDIEIILLFLALAKQIRSTEIGGIKNAPCTENDTIPQ
jgi:hypothetical protein